MLSNLFRVVAITCKGNQISVSVANGYCNGTGLPTVNASANELQTALQIAFAILAAISVLFVIIGGLRYTLSQGNSQRMQEAKNTIIYAVVGLVIAISAEAIVSFALSYL
jgi:uncharacterized membrane protein YidH (DUF202 family)